MAVIEVRGLTKRFGQVLAVDQLSFAVERATALLAVVFCAVAAGTTVGRDVS